MATEYTQLEPKGFGISGWGQDDNEDKEFRTDGFGDNITVYTEYTDD
jgi:hypothetical protein